MLRAFAILLACQLAGETVTRALGLPLPGPVLGLIILVMLLFAVKRRHLVDSTTVDETSLGKVANGLLAVLGILFVPAGVGVIAYLDLLKQEALPILAAVIGGTAITVYVTAIVANRFAASASQQDASTPAAGEEATSDVNS